MVIQPLIGNPYNGYINPYYWVDDHPLLYGNNVSLDPSTNHVPSLKNSGKTHQTSMFLDKNQVCQTYDGTSLKAKKILGPAKTLVHSGE